MKGRRKAAHVTAWVVPGSVRIKQQAESEGLDRVFLDAGFELTDDAETASAFDEEGFFKSGDAVKWIDETDVHLGLKFDGRIAEDFKLATGTFVSVGPLRGNVEAIARGECDVVMFTSAHQVVNLLLVAEQMGLSEKVRGQFARMAVVSVGPTTSETLRDHVESPFRRHLFLGDHAGDAFEQRRVVEHEHVCLEDARVLGPHGLHHLQGGEIFRRDQLNAVALTDQFLLYQVE